jgi:hypothetical protein
MVETENLQAENLQAENLRAENLQAENLQAETFKPLDVPLIPGLDLIEVISQQNLDSTSLPYNNINDSELKKIIKIAKDKFYKIDISDVNNTIDIFHRFINLHPEFFKTNINKKFIIHNNKLLTLFTEKVYFKDTIHKINGFITTDYDDNYYKMIINIKFNSKKCECYIKQVEDYVNHRTKHGDVIELNYNKILNETIIKHCYYKESVEQWKKDVITLQEQFFLPNKDHLLSVINSKIEDKGIGSASNSWNNLILTGLKGSGKSSFIYRVSMTLKLSIISIDISLFLNKKKDLYSLFHGQEFCLPNSNVKHPAIKNSIIVLEEFDNAMNKLLDIENIFNYKDDIKRKYLTYKTDEIKSKTVNFSDYKNVDEENLKENVKAEDYEEYLNKLMMQDGIDIKNNKVDRRKNGVMLQVDHENQINEINMELNKIIKDMDEDNRSDILRLYDLLELFQSPIPIKDRIIMATTNHFDKMSSCLPALFRSGRLTRVEFTYLDWPSLNLLTEYYFKRSMTYEPFKIIIPTSQIIELAVKYIFSKNPFSDFEQELKLSNQE